MGCRPQCSRRVLLRTRLVERLSSRPGFSPWTKLAPVKNWGLFYLQNIIFTVDGLGEKR